MKRDPGMDRVCIVAFLSPAGIISSPPYAPFRIDE